MMPGLLELEDSIYGMQLPAVPIPPNPESSIVLHSSKHELAAALEGMGWKDLAGPLQEATGLTSLAEITEFVETVEDLEPLMNKKGLTKPQLRKLLKQLKTHTETRNLAKALYTEGLPEVEIALRVKNLCHVDTAEMSFEVDVLVCLDWSDAAVAGIPAKQFPTLDWENTYFNPQIIFDNSLSVSVNYFLPGADTIPRIASGIDKATGVPVPNGKGRVRLKKTMRWRGDLQILHACLKSFPFDIQVLPIVVKSVRHNCCPSSRVKLVDPHQRLTDKEYIAEMNTCQANKGHLVIGASGMYQFNLVGLIGEPNFEKSPHGDLYQVSILVQRPPMSNYVWDLIIMNLLLLLCATSFWSSSPELSLRMGIALTVLLTTAAYNSTRPKAIEVWPDLTFQDWSELMTMFCATMIAIFGVFSSVVCGGQHVDAPQWLVKVTEAWEESYPSHCDSGWCYARELDCKALAAGIALWCLLIVYSILHIWRTRKDALSLLKNRGINTASNDAQLQRSKTRREALLPSLLKRMSTSISTPRHTTVSET